MDNINDELQLYRGGDFHISDKFIIKQPTIGDVCEFGEHKYLSMVSTIIATPFDMIAQLTAMGIDFTAITPYQLFCLISTSFTSEDTRLLLGNLDLSKFKPYQKDNSVVLINDDDVEINEFNYAIFTEYIRKIHCIPKQKYNAVANDFAKNELIKEAQMDIEKWKRKNMKFKSTYLPLISSLVNHEGFKFDWNTVWDMKIYAFFDSVQRIQLHENSTHLYTGLYSGCVEFDKIKKDLNWMKELKQ
jgi:hypothetical protein